MCIRDSVWAGVILLGGLSISAIIGGNRTPEPERTAWDVLLEPGQMELEKARLRDAMPDWMFPPTTMPEQQTEKDWHSLPGLFGNGKKYEADQEDLTTNSGKILPDWMFADEE